MDTYRIGPGIFIEANSREEAIRLGVSRRKRDQSERILGAGAITQRFPVATTDPGEQLGPVSPEPDSYTDIAPRSLEDYMNPLSLMSVFSQPPVTGYTDEPGSESEYNPSVGMTWQEVLGIMDPDKFAVMPPMQGYGSMEDGGYINPGMMDTGDVDALAAVQQLTGASPLMNPGMFPSNVDYIALSEDRAIHQMQEDLGDAPGELGVIDMDVAGNPVIYDVDNDTFKGLEMRLSTLFDRSDLAIKEAFSKVDPSVELKIIADPIRDSNTYLFARNKGEVDWQLMDMGFWETLYAEIPAITGELAGAYLTQKVFPGAKGIAGRKFREGLKQAAKLISGATAGGTISTIGYSSYLHEVEDIPYPTFQDTMEEIGEMALTNTIGEGAVRGFLGIGRAAGDRFVSKFGLRPEALEEAWEAHYRWGAPRPISAFFTSNGMFSINRVWNVTTAGRNDAIERVQQAMQSYIKFTDSIGAKKVGRGEVDALQAVNRFDEKLRERIISKAGFPKERGWRESIGDTTKMYYKWSADRIAAFGDRFTALDQRLVQAGAWLDMTKLTDNMRNIIRSRETFRAKGIKIGGSELGETVDRIANQIMAMPPRISGAIEYKSVQQFRTMVDDIDISTLDNEYERQVIGMAKKTLHEILTNPKGISKDKKLRKLVQQTNTQYKAFRDDDTLITAASFIGALQPERIGRTLIDAKNAPTMVKAIRKMYIATGDLKGFKELQGAYTRNLMMGDPDAGLKMVLKKDMDLDSKEAMDFLIPENTRVELAGYFIAKRDLINNPNVIQTVADVTNSGSVMIQAWDAGNKGQFKATIDLLEELYPGEGKKMTAWAILTELGNRSKVRIDGTDALSKELLRGNLTRYMAKGIFDDILTTKQVSQLDGLLTSYTYMPELGGLATSLAGQTMASKTMSGNPLTKLVGRLSLVNMAVHARLLISGITGSPLGYGKRDTVGAPATKVLIGNLLAAYDSMQAFGEKYKPGSRRGMSALQMIEDMNARNIQVYAGREGDDVQPSNNMNLLRNMMEVHKSIEQKQGTGLYSQFLYDPQAIGAFFSAPPPYDTMGASGQVPGPATGDFSNMELSLPEFLK